MELLPSLTTRGTYLRARALWVGLFAALALVVRLASVPPPPRTSEGIAAMLGAAVSGEVGPDDFVWEERGTFLRDAFEGRGVLFLARGPGVSGVETPRDLFRARVRLTRGGRPFALRALRNLTRTPLGDERDLVAAGHHAAFITKAYGAVQGITLLDLDGEGGAREARARSERLSASLESWLATGSLAGLGRVEITFGAPPAEAKHEIEGDSLVAAFGTEAFPAALDLRDGTLNTGPKNAFLARALRIPHVLRPLGSVTIDVVREIGGPWAAHALDALFDATRALAPRPSVRPLPELFPGRALPATGTAQDAPTDGWPPVALAPVLQPPLAREGQWLPITVPGQAADALVCLYETAIRPRVKRPDAIVRLVALDLRQLDLRAAAGFDDPRALTGPGGDARLPIGGASGGATASGSPAESVIAAFAAGPAGPVSTEAVAVAPGFVADGRVLVPMVAGAATVALAADGSAAFGPWPSAEVVPGAFAAAVQAPDPLVGGAGPRIPLPEPALAAERSALCLLPSGQALYAWAAHADADVLRGALELAGCVYGIHLAASPSPTGFAFVRASAAEPGWELSALAREMSLSPARLLAGSPNGFFYAVRRDPRPPMALPSHEAIPGVAAAQWAPDPGRQPAPAWIPAIHAGIVTNLGAQVHVRVFAPGRMIFRLRAGAKEPSTKASALLQGALSAPEAPHVVAAIGVAVARKRGARGLSIDGLVGYPFRGETSGVLVVDAGKIALVKAGEFSPHAGTGIDATEIPLTADEGKLRPEAREVGPMRARAAVCVLGDGAVVLATTTFDTDEATTSALLDLGCTRVAALDRGSHQGAFVHRAGTDTAPAAFYEASVLFAIEAPMSGRGRRIGAAEPTP